MEAPTPERSVPSWQTAVNVTTWLIDGYALHQAGQLTEAERLYRKILAAQPDHFEGLHRLGVISYQRGNYAEALGQIELALARDPDNCPALNSRGLVLKGLRRFDEALASYDRALATQPDYTEALANRGDVLLELKRFEEAVRSYDRALELWPDQINALCNRGAALHTLRRFEEALASYDRALALRPHDAEALCNRGIVLYALNRPQEALASYDAALALQPDYADALCNRGAALHKLRRFEEALAVCERVLTLRPDSAGDHSNRGVILHDLQRLEEAMASHDRALALDPGHANAICNRAATLYELKRFDEALASHESVLAAQPDFAAAHYNEAHCRMLTGDLPRGFEKFEWRWKVEPFLSAKRGFAQPLWLGADDIAGKTILLYAADGFGDTIQLCRYVPLVAARGARVILEVQEPLQELMTSLAGGAQVFARGEPLPDFDLQCPLLSLPLAFRSELATIPAVTPYLSVPAPAARSWNARLGPRNRPRIGLAWSGDPMHSSDHKRSMGLRACLPLLADIDATFVSLQREVRRGDAALLASRSDILHFGAELKDYSDTAALVSNLDLVISVDTSVLHVAGALAKPFWVLLIFVPDWRWLLDRNDSPWYPTARLFRQDETRVWDNVIARANAALHDFVRDFADQ